MAEDKIVRKIGANFTVRLGLVDHFKICCGIKMKQSIKLLPQNARTKNYQLIRKKMTSILTAIFFYTQKATPTWNYAFTRN